MDRRKLLLSAGFAAALSLSVGSAAALPSAGRTVAAPEAKSMVETVQMRRGVVVHRRGVAGARFYGPRRAYRGRWVGRRVGYWGPRYRGWRRGVVAAGVGTGYWGWGYRPWSYRTYSPWYYRPRVAFWGPRYSYWGGPRYYRSSWWGCW